MSVKRRWLSIVILLVVLDVLVQFNSNELGFVAGRTDALQFQPTTEAATTVTITQPGSAYTSRTTTTSGGTTIAITTTITHLATSTSTTTQHTFLSARTSETRTETASWTNVEIFTTTTGIGVPRTIITTLVIRSTATAFFGGYTFSTITTEIRTTFPDSTTTRIVFVTESKSSTSTSTITYPGSTITRLVPPGQGLITTTQQPTQNPPFVTQTVLQPSVTVGSSTAQTSSSNTSGTITPAFSTNTLIAIAGAVLIILALASFKLKSKKTNRTNTGSLKKITSDSPDNS